MLSSFNVVCCYFYAIHSISFHAFTENFHMNTYSNYTLHIINHDDVLHFFLCDDDKLGEVCWECQRNIDWNTKNLVSYSTNFLFFFFSLFFRIFFSLPFHIFIPLHTHNYMWMCVRVGSSIWEIIYIERYKRLWRRLFYFKLTVVEKKCTKESEMKSRNSFSKTWFMLIRFTLHKSNV